ncbi:anti-sigma factor RsbA family regulatory protein [Actinokineospora sp. NPDC004072]
MTFIHPALFYRSDEEYLSVLVPFVTEGLAAGHPVAAAVPTPRLALLRTALDPARVTLIDMSEAGRNPTRIIAGVLRNFADNHPDTHVRIIGEPIWAGRSELEYPACAQHEALINDAFATRDVTIVCPYDTTTLSPTAIADARETHPEIWEPHTRYASAHYAPEAVVSRYNLPLNGTPDAATFPVATSTDISAARRFTAHHARALGLPDHRIVDLELIATELITNSLTHAKSPCTLRLWRHGNHVVCEVTDNGQLTNPLAGRTPAPPNQPFGRGLLLVNDLSDLVRIHTTPTGTTLRSLLRVN